MIHTIERSTSYKGSTFGNWLIDGEWFCHTLEDMIRDMPGVDVRIWKIHGVTAIPQGRYRLTLEHSPRFGADTITVHAVPGFDGVRVHGGNTAADTEGCPLVGSAIDREAGNISGARADGVLDALKAKIREAIARGEECWLEIHNPA